MLGRLALLDRRRLFASLAIAVVVLVFASLGVRAAHSNRLMPGTVVAGIDIGGLTVDEARDRLRAASSRPLLVAGISIPPERAGLAWDVDSTLARAEDSGRVGPLLGLVSTLWGVVAERRVDPELRTDTERQRRVVAAVAGRLDRPVEDGGFRIDPETLRARIDRPRDGRRVRRDELLRRLRRAAASTSRRRVDAPLRSEPAVEIEDVETVARQAERYLEQPLRLTGGRRPVEIAPSELASALTMSTRDGAPPTRLSVPGDGLRPILRRAASRLERPTRSPRFARAGDSVLLEEKGDVRWRPREVGIKVTPGRSGRSIDMVATTQAIGDAVRAGRHRVRVSRTTEPPVVSEDEARRVDSVIGTFTTRYEPGQPRVRNIRRMARAVDGTVIAAGAQFSLNGVAGPRTREKGYVPAPFIADGRIVPSVGGGVSQFSTTLYNAAYFAGLQLDSSQSHSLYIDRYPPGREATLDFDSIDLRWTNDTRAPVVVEASSTDTSVTVTLLGDNGGRRVQAQAGERLPAAGGDFQITVTRILRYADDRVVSQPRVTRYETPVDG